MTRATRHATSGFSLIELLFATALLLIISAIVTSALLQMTNSQKTIWNRTEMHSGIRGATELLQQEVGQAGKISLPNPGGLKNPLTITQAINDVGGAAPAAQVTCNPATPAVGAVPVTVSSTAGLWATTGATESYINLTTLDGDFQESVRVAAITNATTLQACFTKKHLAGTVLRPLGGFATGIVPPAVDNNGVALVVNGFANGSDLTTLKLYGDVNSDGDMVYIEYTCDYVSNPKSFYRVVKKLNDATAKQKPTAADVLLSNIIPNPGAEDKGCFAYQPITVNVDGTPFTFVLDVAVTLTVESEERDPLTKQKQKETKALLNVSPRNVFATWAFAGMSYTDRIQSTPTRVLELLPPA